MDKEFLTRFWNMIGKTIYYAQKTCIEKWKVGLSKYSKKVEPKVNL